MYVRMFGRVFGKTIAFLGLLAFVAGCGSAKMPPVSGTVTVKGAPLSKGSLSFRPDAGNPTKFVPAGIIEGGKYTISTNGKPGAPLGKYKVLVVAQQEVDSTRPEEAKSLINPAYSDPAKTTLSVEVVEKPAANAYNFDLK